jgi:ATP-binding cassette subfamily B protein
MTNEAGAAGAATAAASNSPHGGRLSRPGSETRLRSFLGVFKYSRAALSLVWTTSRGLTVCLATLTAVAGVIPAIAAYVGRWIVDAVVEAAQGSGDPAQALRFVAIEAGLIVALVGVQRGISVCQSLLRALLGQRVNVMILEKALTLDLAHLRTRSSTTS